MTANVAFKPESDAKPPAPKAESTTSKRLLIGGSLVALGALAIAAGAIGVWARASQLTIDNALVNARILRVKTPIAGQFKSVYVAPGVPVNAGQVLARIQPAEQQTQAMLQLQGEQRNTIAQLKAAEATLSESQGQLAQLGQAGEAITNADSSIAAASVEQARSQVEQARSKVQFARSQHERFRALAAEGAIAQSIVDEKQADLNAAQATLKSAEASLQESQTALSAKQSGAQYSTSGLNVLDQRARLGQSMQTQTALIASLKSQLDSINARLAQAKSQFSTDRDLVVKAPASGVVYSIASEQSEQTNQLEPILTLLDCQTLWVEGVMSAQEASQIDTRQPVQVSLLGEDKPLRGEVDLLQAVGNTPAPSTGSLLGGERINVTQLQALTPPVRADLAGQPLMRVTVRIQPSTKITQSRQFCGVGQVARMTFAKKSFGF